MLKRIYREKDRSRKLIEHSILLADYFLNLQATISTEKLHFYTKTDLYTHTYLPTIRPDAYIAREGEQTKRYFLEIIDEGTPRFMIRKKISNYFDYFEENTWQNTTGHQFPTVLLLCPNATMMQFLQRHLSQVLEEEPNSEISFYLSLTSPIKWIHALEEIETAPGF